MSRSRKKTAGWVHKDTITKKKFNRSLRRKARQAVVLEDVYEDDVPDIYMSHELGNGKEYRKHNCSYDICDCKGIWWSKKEYVNWQPRWLSLTGNYFNDVNKWYKEVMK